MGLSSREVAIDIQNTEIVNIPTALFFPVPMSSRINLDVRDSRLASLGPQLLNTLESKQRHIRHDAYDRLSFVFSAVVTLCTTYTQYDESRTPLDCCYLHKSTCTQTEIVTTILICPT